MASQPPLANIVTLGVHDLARERGFYQRLGWPIVLDSDDFIVFELRRVLLALFPARPPPTRAHPSSAEQAPHPNLRDHLGGPGRGRGQPRRAGTGCRRHAHQRTHRRGVLRRPRRLLRRPGRQLLGDRLVSGQQPRCGGRPPSRRATRLSCNTSPACAHFAQCRIGQPPPQLTVYSAIARARRGQVRTAAITAGSRSVGSTDPRGGTDPPSGIARPADATVPGDGPVAGDGQVGAAPAYRGVILAG